MGRCRRPPSPRARRGPAPQIPHGPRAPALIPAGPKALHPKEGAQRVQRGQGVGVWVAVGLRDPPQNAAPMGGVPECRPGCSSASGQEGPRAPSRSCPKSFGCRDGPKAPCTKILGCRDGSRTLPVRNPEFFRCWGAPRTLGAEKPQKFLMQTNPKGSGVRCPKRFGSQHAPNSPHPKSFGC